jgi:hypothetical protein
MRHARQFNSEWGYVAPAHSVMRIDCLIVVAAIILAVAGVAMVFSLLHGPKVKELVAARTLVAPEVSLPVTAGTSVATQQPTKLQEDKSSLVAPEAPLPVTAGTSVAMQLPTEPQEDKLAYVPRWGVWLAADLSESGAWALYHERVKRFASLIGDREPVVLFRQLPAMGKAKRYIIAIVDDDRAPLDKFCEKLTAAGSTCNVMRNEFGP